MTISYVTTREHITPNLGGGSTENIPKIKRDSSRNFLGRFWNLLTGKSVLFSLGNNKKYAVDKKSLGAFIAKTTFNSGQVPVKLTDKACLAAYQGFKANTDQLQSKLFWKYAAKSKDLRAYRIPINKNVFQAVFNRHVNNIKKHKSIIGPEDKVQAETKGYWKNLYRDLYNKTGRPSTSSTREDFSPRLRADSHLSIGSDENFQNRVVDEY